MLGWRSALAAAKGGGGGSFPRSLMMYIAAAAAGGGGRGRGRRSCAIEVRASLFLYLLLLLFFSFPPFFKDWWRAGGRVACGEDRGESGLMSSLLASAVDPPWEFWDGGAEKAPGGGEICVGLHLGGGLHGVRGLVVGREKEETKEDRTGRTGRRSHRGERERESEREGTNPLVVSYHGAAGADIEGTVKSLGILAGAWGRDAVPPVWVRGDAVPPVWVMGGERGESPTRVELEVARCEHAEVAHVRPDQAVFGQMRARDGQQDRRCCSAGKVYSKTRRNACRVPV